MSVFGEIQLGMSRAVSDDEDDEFSMVQEDINLKRKIYWLKETESEEKIKPDELIVADGTNSSAFIYTYLLSHYRNKDDNIQVLGLNGTLSDFKVFKQNHDDVKNKKVEISFRSNLIYLINNSDGKSFVICQIYDQLKTNELYDWLKQLLVRVDFSDTLIFCSQNKSHYLGNEQKNFPLMRYLSSKKIQESNLTCIRLEEPNFIGDLPAALIHYCVANKLDFSAFVCYTPSLTADSLTVTEMYNAASKNLKETSPFVDDELSQKTLLSIGNIVSSVSALYM